MKLKKQYYYLNTDNYGQPDGTIREISKTEYIKMKKNNTGWVYDNYESAMYRAMD